MEYFFHPLFFVGWKIGYQTIFLLTKFADCLELEELEAVVYQIQIEIGHHQAFDPIVRHVNLLVIVQRYHRIC